MKQARRVLVLRLVVAGSALACLAYVLLAWRDYRDPQGEATAWCDKIEFEPKGSPDGRLVVTGHTTACDGFGGNSAVYVYIHPTHLDESRDDLVFRYSEHGGEEAVHVQWLDSGSVEIAVPHLQQITKALDGKAGVKLLYKIGWQDYPPR